MERIHVGPIILIVVGAVLAITVHWVGAALVVVGVILFAYHWMSSGKASDGAAPPPPPNPER